jgi:DNA topoisomerase-2
MWTEEFKEMLEQTIDAGGNGGSKVHLKNYESHYNDIKAEFVLHFASKGELDRLMAVDNNGFKKIENELKLVSTKNLGTSNMYLFDATGKIEKFNTLAEIFQAFYVVRLDFYGKRKDHLVKHLEAEKRYLEARIVFINEIIEGTLAVSNVPKADVEAQLAEKSYPMRDDSYDYLVGMPIYNLTMEKKARLQADLDALMAQLNKVLGASPEAMWMEELDELEAQYTTYIKAYEARVDDKAATRTKQGGASKGVKKK